MTEFNTEQMLIMRYNFRPMIKLEDVAADYLPDIKLTELKRKAREGSLPFPVSVNGTGRATTYHVPLKALANWIDEQSQTAIDDFHAMQI